MINWLRHKLGLCVHDWGHPAQDEIERLQAVVRGCDELEKILTAEVVSLREQVKRDEEHYQLAMAMNEKHRRLWVEASAKLPRSE